VDTAFNAAFAQKSLRYHARRQSLKYLKYLKENDAPYERYADPIGRRYGVRDTVTYRLSLTLKKLLEC
jgi:hypothetical protein